MGRHGLSTSKSFFNGRDQVTLARQFAGTENSATYQDTVMTYDGYGRLKTQKVPEQNANTATIYNYYADDRIQQVVDARGATVNYVYDVRGLTTQVSTTSPNPSTIPITPTVTMTYDNLGNRTQMTDGLGTQTYEYNQLSQLTAETRSFTDSLPNAPLANNSFRLEYGYTLSGQHKHYKDPYGQQINYAFDKTGRLNSVTGSTPFAGMTNYANSPVYNARGILTNLNYGNGVTMSLSNFNNKLQATTLEVKKNSTIIQKKNYEFYGDSSLKYSQDVPDGKFDRLYRYDVVGRTTQAWSGAFARGQTDAEMNVPYRQLFTYNAFGNRTSSFMQHFVAGNSEGSNFINNRKQFGTYDAEGNEVSDDNAVYEFDAQGELTKTTPRDAEDSNIILPYPTLRFLDGTGKEVKRVKNWINPLSQPMVTTEYFIYSSATGKLVSEANATGVKVKTFITANGTTLAEQERQVFNNNAETVTFYHQDASGASLQQTNPNGVSLGRISEFDATGNNVGTVNPYLQAPSGGNEGGSSLDFGSSPYGQSDSEGNPRLRQKKEKDGVSVPDSYFRGWMERMYGGVFGLLEHNARMSAPKFKNATYSVTDADGTVTDFGSDGAKAIGWQMEMHGEMTITRNWSVSNDWGINLSIISWGERQTGQLEILDYFNLIRSPDNFVQVRFKDKSAAKSLLQSVSKDCRDKLNAVLAALNTISKINPARKLDIVELFDDINGQEKGGLDIDSNLQKFNAVEKEVRGFNTPDVPGGGGLTTSVLKNQRNISEGAWMITHVFTGSAQVNGLTQKGKRRTEKYIRELARGVAWNKLFGHLVHELIHSAGFSSTFSHEQMDAAANKVDSKITSFDDLLRKWCMPEGYRNGFIYE